MNAITDFISTHNNTQKHPMVTAGLISVHLEVIKGGIVLHAPLCFDGETVAETGLWSYGIDPDDDDAVSDAICDAYRKSYEAWCAQKDEQVRIEKLLGPKIRSRRQGGAHTPCPALWAGR